MSPRTAAAAATVGGLLGTAAVYAYFVRTAAGQRLDARLAPRHGFLAANRLLAAYDRNVVIAEAIVLLAVVVIAARRRIPVRGVLSAAMPLAVVGADNIAKLGLPRPAFTASASTHNSFPGGHVALASATVLAVCLVVPLTARVVVALAGSVAVALVTVATIVAGWHRFSDGVGAILLAVAGAGLVVLLSPTEPRRDPTPDESRPISAGANAA